MITKDEVLLMTRHDVRYQLYRIRTYVNGGCSPPINDLKEYYENQAGFTEWNDFARTWDVGITGKHHKIVFRQFTEEQEWNKQLSSLVGD